MRGDHFLLGFILGLVAPALGFLIYCLVITGLVRSDMTLRYFVVDMIFGLKRNLAPALSLSLCADVGLFFLLDRYDRHKAMRGVIAAMFVYGVIIVIFIALWGRELFIAGEASGDLHGSNLLRELRRMDPSLEVEAWGGDRMAAEGATVLKHYRDLAFMGFTQVVMHLLTILRNISLCKAQILDFRPDVLVLIDYPGFNLRIADWAREQGIPVVYYISPQLWAWKENRIEVVKRAVDRMLVILPFEKEWYAQRGVSVDFVGHPLLDELARSGNGNTSHLSTTAGPVALLPGSRTQEISRMLPRMLEAAKNFPQERFVIAAAPAVPDAFYQQMIGDAPVELLRGRIHDLLRQAKAAVVTSGTATLETALFGVPEVVCYSGSAINVWLARRLVKVKFISLVNLIMDREVVRELIQHDMNADNIRMELDRLLHDLPYRTRMLHDLDELRDRLGGPGASNRAAQLVWKSLQDRPATAVGRG